MNCSLCNGTIETMRGDIQLSSRMLGDVSIPGIKYEICQACGDITVSVQESQRAIEQLKEMENASLAELPLNEFISLNEAANLLKITKQAFNKNSRIKRGFIYSVKKWGRRFFLKDSVLRFKEDGKDGRIDLSKHQAKLIEVAPVIIYIPVVEKYIEPEPWMTTDDQGLANINNAYCH